MSLALALAALLAAPAPDPFLSRLEGRWTATGQVRGKPVTYDAEASFVLGGAFLLLSLEDTAVPSGYQARIFIGRSVAKGDYVAHWLDGFGADGARVVGTGTGTATTLELTFPYEGGPFRDRFELRPDGTVSLVIDAAGADGGVRRFADYVLVRKPGRR